MAIKKLKNKIIIPIATIMLIMGTFQQTSIDAIEINLGDVTSHQIDNNYIDPNKNIKDTRVEGQAYDDGWLASYNNFLEMRRELEKLTGSYVINGKGYGNLYRAVGMSDWTDETDDQMPTIRTFYLTSWYRRTVYTKAMQTELRKIAAKTFTDVNENDWYSPYIPIAVYMGTINGYPDKTFKGNSQVTYAEFAKMFTTSIWEKNDGKHAESLFGEQWFNCYLKALDFGVYYGHMTIAELNSPISRGEVAMIIARTLYTDDMVELNRGFTNGNISKSSIDFWSDIKIVGNDLGMGDVSRDTVYKNLQNSKKDSSVVPQQTYACIEALRKYNVMTGNENKECNWNKPITRAEVLKMLITAVENMPTVKEAQWTRE